MSRGRTKLRGAPTLALKSLELIIGVRIRRAARDQDPPPPKFHAPPQLRLHCSRPRMARSLTRFLTLTSRSCVRCSAHVIIESCPGGALAPAHASSPSRPAHMMREGRSLLTKFLERFATGGGPLRLLRGHVEEWC